MSTAIFIILIFIIELLYKLNYIITDSKYTCFLIVHNNIHIGINQL